MRTKIWPRYGLNKLRQRFATPLQSAAMGTIPSHNAIQAEIDAVMRGEQVDANFTSSPSGNFAVRVVPIKTTGGARADGLKDDAPNDVGFGFAVAEAELRLDTTHMSANQIAVAHQVLWEAGTDDWMEYSHLLTHDAAQIKAGETLALSFSSSAKGARVVGEILIKASF